MPPPYTAAQINGIVTASVQRGGHPLRHMHPNPTPANLAAAGIVGTAVRSANDMEDVIRAALNAGPLYTLIGLLGVHNPAAGHVVNRLQATVSLQGITDRNGFPLLCADNSNPGAGPLAQVSAARIVIDYAAGGVWFIRTCIPYNNPGLNPGMLAHGQLIASQLT